MTAADCTPEFCRILERIYWRNSSLGRVPRYGTDMKGAAFSPLFTEESKHCNVPELTSTLICLVGNDSKISGINTSYLYFDIWGATVAWHVEDMDLSRPNTYTSKTTSLAATRPSPISFLPPPTLLFPPPGPARRRARRYLARLPCELQPRFQLRRERYLYTQELDPLRAAFCACKTDSVRIDVGGLIEAREREKNAEAQAQIVIDGVEGIAKPKRPKTAKALPASPESNAPQQPHNKLVIKSKLPATDVVVSLAFPCSSCPSTAVEGLLRLQDAPMSFSGVAKPKAGVCEGHSGDVGKEKVMWAVDGIVKDRWMLYAQKGKCSKAFHVSCVVGGGASDVAYRGLEEVEKEVVLMEEVRSVPPAAAPESPPPNVMDVDEPTRADVPPSTTAPTTGPRQILMTLGTFSSSWSRIRRTKLGRRALVALSEMRFAMLPKEELISASVPVGAYGARDDGAVGWRTEEGELVKQSPPALPILATVTTVHTIALLYAPVPAPKRQRCNLIPSTCTRATVLSPPTNAKVNRQVLHAHQRRARA
ncbi:hypothetical protein K439DRAFT_1619890 [Ramaria rubella]|nr:hypothetical protein K439DRAFT_1619890 [Ramaria rubella]